MTSPDGRSRHTVFLAVVVALLLGGCRVDATVEVHAEPDGSGHVEVRVALDREAAEQLGRDRLRTDDLTRAGWDVEGPTQVEGGGRAILARRSFRSPDEAEQAVAQVAGDGVLRGFDLDRDRSFLETRTRLRGTIDLRAGVVAFGDPGLTQRLGGQPFGVDPAQLGPLDDSVRVRLVAELPGHTEQFSARAGQEVAVDVHAETWNRLSIVLAVLALVCGAGSLLTFRRLRRRRP